MTRIRPSWTPPNTDNSSGERALGFDFQADIAITANGAWWFQDGTAPPSTVRAMLWLTSGPTLVADSGTVSTAGFTLSAWNFIPFASGFSCAANTAYTIDVYSTGTYRYTNTDLASDIFDASGHVKAIANTGRFANAAGPVFPSSIFPGGGMFGTDLDFTAGSSTVNGTATLTGAGTLTAAATVRQNGTATLAAASTLTLAPTVRVPGVLAMTATSTLTAVTSGGIVYRPNTGTVARPGTGTVVRPYTGIVHRP